MNTSSFRQYAALGFCAFTVPAILFLPQCGWVWATGAALATALVCAGGPVSPPKGGTSTLLLLWNWLMLGYFASKLSLQAQSDLPGLLLLLLAAYAAQCKTLPRVAAVLSFFLVAMYGALLVFALPELRTTALAPKLQGDWCLLPFALAPTAVCYLCKERGKAAPWLVGGILLAGLAAVVTQGLRATDFYTAAKSVTVLGVMERLEPLVLSALTAGGFCLMGLLCTVNGELSEGHATAILNVLGGAAGYLLLPCLPPWLIATGTAIFWGLLPFCLQLVEILKKFKKSEKSA